MLRECLPLAAYRLALATCHFATSCCLLIDFLRFAAFRLVTFWCLLAAMGFADCQLAALTCVWRLHHCYLAASHHATGCLQPCHLLSCHLL